MSFSPQSENTPPRAEAGGSCWARRRPQTRGDRQIGGVVGGGLATALLLIAVLPLSTGCRRDYYRRQADVEAYELIEQRNNHPHWPLENHAIEIDPRSRMYDPFDRDRPPMPPDDPDSHQYMHRVASHRGYRRWHANGDTLEVENPCWVSDLPVDESGQLLLTADDSVRLALLHSPDFQRELEDLYLSALDVSFERFRLDSQFFGGYETEYTADGRARSSSGGRSRSRYEAATFPGARGIRMDKLGASGTDLVVGLANSLVWQFAGTNTHSATTLLDFAIVQPLLRQGGRDVVLERLTLSERNLLASVRQMERFRREFYLNIVTGRTSGFGGAGSAGGIMGLMQTQQEIRNDQDNLVGLRTNVYRLQLFLDESQATVRPGETPTQRKTSILRDSLQVAQARQAVYNADARLLSSYSNYEVALDNFKLDLGLPPQLCAKVVDSMLDQFQLTGAEIRARREETDALVETAGQTNDAILARVVESPGVEGEIPKRTLRWSEELETDLRRLQTHFDALRAIRDAASDNNMPEVLADLEYMKKTLPRRAAHLRRLEEKYGQQTDELCPLLNVPEIDPAVFDVARLEMLPKELEDDYSRLERQLVDYTSRLDELDQHLEKLLTDGKQRENDAGNPASDVLFDEVVDNLVFTIQNLLTDFSDDILAMQLIQARARTDSIELPAISITWQWAVEIARRCRRDWMNARAVLVDVWRLIEFNADDLESTLDVVFAGDISNTGDNPLRLRDSTGRLQVGLQFDAPITRLSERNAYRQALIDYQQARRAYYQFEDQIAQSLRGTLRTIEVNQLNFELRRFAVYTAAQQIMLTAAIQEESQGQTAGSASSATAARDAVSALADLQNAQNDFLGVWVNYEVLRRVLDLDLGTMQLDAEGLWIDPGPMEPDYGADCAGMCGDYSEEVILMPHEAAALQAAQRAEEILPIEDIETIDLPPPAPLDYLDNDNDQAPGDQAPGDSGAALELPRRLPVVPQQGSAAPKPLTSSRRTAPVRWPETDRQVVPASVQARIIDVLPRGSGRPLFGPPRPPGTSRQTRP